MNDRPIQLSIWDDIPAPPVPESPDEPEPIVVADLVDWSLVTPDSIMKYGKYKDRPVMDAPYDYLLHIYIQNIATGSLKKYIERLIDATKANYNNLIHHRSSEYYATR